MLGVPTAVGKARGGRRAEADRNDITVLAAARDVFVEQGWEAPIAAIAARAGVGTGSIYRRYPSKVDLLRALCGQAIAQAAEQARTALAEEPDGWSALRRFLLTMVRARSCTLFVLVGGTVEDNGELGTAVGDLHAAIDALVSAAHDQGALRDGVTGADVYLLLTQLRSPLELDSDRVLELQLRLLDVVLAGLTAPAAALPTPAPTWSEMAFRDAPELD